MSNIRLCVLSSQYESSLFHLRDPKCPTISQNLYNETTIETMSRASEPKPADEKSRRAGTQQDTISMKIR